jgi:hypothetical protein
MAHRVGVSTREHSVSDIKVERLLTWFEHVSGSGAIPVVNVGKIFSFVIDTLGEHACPLNTILTFWLSRKH